VFALVIYIPDPLGRFLDDLRCELVPDYKPHAHVSVLPPRTLAVEPQVAITQIADHIGGWKPFEVELSEVQVFPQTDVLYLGLGRGAEELHRMHDAIACGGLQFAEPFDYHPHVTLAQEVPHDAVAALCELARRRWREYPGPRSFRATKAVFVQNEVDNIWTDLAALSFEGKKGQAGGLPRSVRTGR
jgi:hypothetical protein